MSKFTNSAINVQSMFFSRCIQCAINSLHLNVMARTACPRREEQEDVWVVLGHRVSHAGEDGCKDSEHDR